MATPKNSAAAPPTIAPRSEQPVVMIPPVAARPPQKGSMNKGSISLLRWAGSKARLMPKFVPMMPDHLCYVDLFGGSANAILFKERSKVEVFNDVNPDVVNLFRVLRSKQQRRQLCDWLAFTPYSRLQFAQCLGLLYSDEPDMVKRAWSFLYCAHSRFAGVDPGICTPGSFAVPKTHGLRSDWHTMSARIEAVARRFKEVILEQDDWQRIVARYDALTTLFYCDPPYLLSTRVGRLYRHEMTVEQHTALLDALRQVKGYVLLSGYANDLYRDRLAKWRRVDFEVKCSISPAKKKPLRIESVWMNYSKDGKHI